MSRARTTNNALQPLRDWLVAHPDAEEAVATLQGGTVTVQPNGKKHIVMPWPRYSRTILDFWAAMDGVHGWDYASTSDYFAITDRWLKSRRVRHLAPEHFADMDRATVLGVLRWIDRGEKFCDGHWAGCYKQGLFQAAARALIALGIPDVPPSSSAPVWVQGDLFS